MRGSSAEEVAERILEHTDFPGLQVLQQYTCVGRKEVIVVLVEVFRSRYLEMNWEQAVDIFLIHAHVSNVTSQDGPKFVCFFWCEFKSIAQDVLVVFQGPTISPVYTTKNGNISVDYYAIVICVPKPKLYHAVRQLRKVHSSWPFQFDRFPCAVLNVMKHKLISNHYCTDCCSF